jgi:hypothetical protein
VARYRSAGEKDLVKRHARDVDEVPDPFPDRLEVDNAERLALYVAEQPTVDHRPRALVQ